MGGYTDALTSQVESPSVGRSKVRSITLTLTAAQILALNTTPVLILPAPGPGKIILVLGSSVFLHFGGIAYAGGGNFRLSYNNADAQATWLLGLAGTIDAAVDTFSSGTGGVAFALLASQVVNSPLYITTGATAFSTGNGTLTCTVYYSIVDTALLQ